MPEIKRKEFARVLRLRGITAYRLSQMLGYKDPYHVYKWIYGRGAPSAATMLRLMEILDVSAEEILRMFAEGASEKAKES